MPRVPLVSDLSVTSWQLVANTLATSPTSPRGNVTDKSRRVVSCRDALPFTNDNVQELSQLAISVNATFRATTVGARPK